MFEPIFLSIRVALLATVIAFFLGVLFAYLLTKKKVPGKNIWETILILPMILPPSIVGYLLLKVFGKRGPIGAFLLDTFGIQIVFTWIACVIAATVVALPLMYQNAKGAFQSADYIIPKAFDPRVGKAVAAAVAEAARASGVARI